MFSLTRQERTVFVATLVILLLGALGNYGLKKSQSLNRAVNFFDSGLLSQRVDINTADEEELQRLPFIGPAISRRIMDYRKQHGGFKSVEEIRNVKGIGKARYEQIAPFVTVASRGKTL
jgi:competence protein ComEA